MVKGLDKFKDHFVGFKGQYILIGGAACDLLHEDAGIEFRVTNDLDIVLCLEALDLRVRPVELGRKLIQAALEEEAVKSAKKK